MNFLKMNNNKILDRGRPNRLFFNLFLTELPPHIYNGKRNVSNINSR